MKPPSTLKKYLKDVGFQNKIFKHFTFDHDNDYCIICSITQLIYLHGLFGED